MRFDFAEIVHRFHFQLFARFIVADDHSIFVQLKRCYRPLVRNGSFDALGDRTRFYPSRRHDDHFIRIADGSDTDAQRLRRNFRKIAAKKPRVRVDRFLRQRRDMRARCEGRTGLVERDVSVASDTAEKKVYAARSFDRFFISGAFGFFVLCNARSICGYFFYRYRRD